MSLKFYGKKSCNTCKKAKAFLEGQRVDFEEISIEAKPPARKVLEQLVDASDIKASLNARSTIYKEKNLSKATPDKKTAIDLMLEDPNLIKRPLIVTDDGALYQGFDEQSLSAFLKGK